MWEDYGLYRAINLNLTSNRSGGLQAPWYSILDRQSPHHTESNQPLQTLHHTNLCDMATEWMLVDDLETPFFLWGTQITSYGQARDMVQGNAPGLLDSFDALFRTFLCVI